ncbi:MAG: hypothetical protein IJ242_06605 [Clostridia bacterium]|nr:hypothetical protein [Clostridia bacterium]
MVIAKVNVGITDGGFSCGPVSGHVVAEAKVIDGEKVFYAGLEEVEGMMNYYDSDESLYEDIISESFEDGDYLDWGCEYEEYYENPDEDPEKDALIRYLIYVVRTDWDTCNAFVQETEGKDLMEIEIPKYIDEDEET